MSIKDSYTTEIYNGLTIQIARMGLDPDYEYKGTVVGKPFGPNAVQRSQSIDDPELEAASWQSCEMCIRDRGTVAEIARQIVKKYFVDTAGRQFASLQIGTIPSLTESISRQYKGDKVGEACYELLREAELSQRIRFDYLNNTLIYEVWQGLDRTQNQIANEWAIFSDNMETITDFGYERDITDHCNFAYVVGDEITVEIDQTHGARRRELYVHGSTSRKNDDGSAMTDAQYREKLRQDCLLYTSRCV